MIHLKRLLSGAKQSLSISPAKYGCLLVALVILIILAQPGSLMAQDTGKTDQWQFMIEPYIWLPAIGGETTNGSDFSLSLDDVVSDLQFGLMGIVGVKKGKWSFMVDTFYADIEVTKDGIVQTDVEVKTWIVTPVVGYNLVDCKKGKLDIVAGARYVNVEIDVSVTSDRARALNPEFSGSEGIWDGIVGLKGEIALYEQLYMPLYLDIGTGGSDFSWQVAGGLGYRFGACDVIAGYRYLSVDFKDSSPVKDINLSGPYIGLKFIF